MHLVGTSDLIDEVLVNSSERRLSRTLMDDLRINGEVDESNAPHFYLAAIRGLMSGEYLVDKDGAQVHNHIVDCGDSTWSTTLDHCILYYGSLLGLPLGDIQNLIRALLAILREARTLISKGWSPERETEEYGRLAANYVMRQLGADPKKHPNAHRTKIVLGLRRSEYYRAILGIYSLKENTIRLRRDISTLIEAIVSRKATVAHETVHAVTMLLAGPGNLSEDDRSFLEGLAELYSYEFLKHRLETLKDWAFLFYRVAYKRMTPPDYVKWHFEARRLYDIGGNKLLSKLLTQRFPILHDGQNISRADVISSIVTVMRRTNKRIAKDLISKVLATDKTQLQMITAYRLGHRGRTRLLRISKSNHELFEFIKEINSHR